MRLGHALKELAEFPKPESVERFVSSIEPAWIEEALQRSGVVTLRRRRLPAERVIWLVIGMALFRDRPIWEVVDKLDLALKDRQQPCVSPSASVKAKQRVGDKPLQWLFEYTGARWGHDSAQEDVWQDLSLYGVDGTTFKVAESEDNRRHFGLAKGGHRGDSGYPMLRLCALMALRSHLIIKANFGPYCQGEYSYAQKLWPSMTNNSLVVLDRNFWSAYLLMGLASSGTNRHWLIRAKKNVQGRTNRQLAEHDELVEMKVSSGARKRDPHLPKTWTVRVIHYQVRGFRPQRLITSLLDPIRYPASELVKLYHERWEIELGYGEIKTAMLEHTHQPLRSQSVAMVNQEMLGILLAYNLVRLQMQRVAQRFAVPTNRISFSAVYRMICDEWLWLAISTPGAIPKRLRQLEERIHRFVLPERRRERIYPRAVKIKMSTYRKKTRASSVSHNALPV